MRSRQKAGLGMRTLHQQGSQMRIAFLADVHLRLALAGVPPSRLQPQGSSPRPGFCESDGHLPASAKKVSAISVPTPFTCFKAAPPLADSSPAPVARSLR